MTSDHNRPLDRHAAIASIRTAMVEKKITQSELADLADCHEKTVQNLLAGRSVRDQTLFDVCMVLGLEYVGIKAAWTGSAVSGPMELRGDGGLASPVYMGAYTRAAVDHYIGSYLTIRPAFSKPDVIIAYRTQIVWDSSWPSLLFEEFDRPDVNFQHRGRIYVPASSMFIHLVSLTKGAMRMVTVSQLDQTGHMRGIISTLNRQGALVVPVASPIVYKMVDTFRASQLGEIAPGSSDYDSYAQVLAETTRENYARVVP